MPRDERGSVALVVMVIFVMASLATIMVTNNAGEARRARAQQDRGAALGAADLALARAMARISVGETAATFTESGSAGGTSWRVDASRATGTRWVATATGRSSAASRTVAADVVRNPSGRWVITAWRETP